MKTPGTRECLSSQDYGLALPTELIPFQEALGERLLAEVGAPEQLDYWTACSDYPPTLALFRRWHGDPDVHPHLLVVGDRPVGYGEIWEDAGEAELARLFVLPHSREQGYGLELVGGLMGIARRSGFTNVWLRVLPDNVAAISCYQRAGFVRALPLQEAALNRGQPHVYQWMYHVPQSNNPSPDKV